LLGVAPAGGCFEGEEIINRIDCVVRKARRGPSRDRIAPTYSPEQEFQTFLRAVAVKG